MSLLPTADRCFNPANLQGFRHSHAESDTNRQGSARLSASAALNHEPKSRACDQPAREGKE